MLILHLSGGQLVVLYGRYHRWLEAILHLRLPETSGIDLRFRLSRPPQGSGSRRGLRDARRERRRLWLALRDLARGRRTQVLVLARLGSLHQIVHNLLSEGYRRVGRRRLRPQHHVAIVFPRQYHQFDIGEGHVALADVDIIIVY